MTTRLSTGLRRYRDYRALGLSVLDAMRAVSQPALAGGVGTGFIGDLKNNLLAANGANTIKPQALTATANGAAVDLVDADGSCFATLHVGAVTGTTPTLDVKIQESDTSGGTYTDITGATFVQITASDKYLVINFKRSKRFGRAVATIAGTTPSFTFAVAILGQKKST